MRGQWIGTFEATPGGVIVINIDEMEAWYEGTAYLHPSNNAVPKSEVVFCTEGKDTNHIKFKTNMMFPLHPATHERMRWEELKHLFAPDSVMSNSADVEGKVEAGKLSLSWKTDIQPTGHCSLEHLDSDKASVLESQTISWDEFKRRVAQLEGEQRYIFRGQSQPLRTAFHRHKRYDLRRFLEHDIPLLHKHLSARTRHYFNLQDRQQNAAFLSSAQHHGYPTNLLDWTYSPYVAAFFAFRAISQRELREAKPSAKVRIYLFDCGLWTQTVQQILTITSPILNVSLIDVLAIENERLIPQQAVALISTVDDIEAHILRYEQEKVVLLRAFDIPVIERDKVLNELRYMGITAGSMFPGLDGACEELRERNFKY